MAPTSGLVSTPKPIPSQPKTRESEISRSWESDNRESTNPRTREPNNPRTRQSEKSESSRARESENPRIREPENPRTQKPENPRTREPKNPRTRESENLRTREVKNRRIGLGRSAVVRFDLQKISSSFKKGAGNTGAPCKMYVLGYSGANEILTKLVPNIPGTQHITELPLSAENLQVNVRPTTAATENEGQRPPKGLRHSNAAQPHDTSVRAASLFTRCLLFVLLLASISSLTVHSAFGGLTSQRTPWAHDMWLLATLPGFPISKKLATVSRFESPSNRPPKLGRCRFDLRSSSPCGYLYNIYASADSSSAPRETWDRTASPCWACLWASPA